MTINNQNLIFDKLCKDDQIPYKLLLLADPSKELIDEYLKTSDVYTANENNVSNWPSDLMAYSSRNNPNPQAVEFNQKWINEIIKSNYRIYDAGRPNGYSPFYHGIEINTIQNYNYNNVYQTNSFFNNNLIINSKL